MYEDNITPDALSDESQLNSADAYGTVDAVTSGQSADALTLSELNEKLGKNFQDKETALKALKDTFSYVGKKKEDVVREVKSELNNEAKTDQLAKELQELRRERFFDKNPQYADASVRKLIESLGGEPHSVVERPEFKDVFEKVARYEESAKNSNVLESNSRLAQSKDTIQKAKELQKSGASQSEVEDLITKAVLGQQ